MGGFKISRNPYDWLGDGVYFFQDAPQRAWEWASEQYGEEAAVVGATIRLIDCIDLLDTKWTTAIASIYDQYLTMIKKSGVSLPLQSDGSHRLDREVINYTVEVLQEQGTTIRCARGAFSEGHPVYPDSAFYSRAHLQIAVRDVDMCVDAVWLEEVR